MWASPAESTLPPTSRPMLGNGFAFGASTTSTPAISQFAPTQQTNFFASMRPSPEGSLYAIGPPNPQMNPFASTGPTTGPPSNGTSFFASTRPSPENSLFAIATPTAGPTPEMSFFGAAKGSSAGMTPNPLRSSVPVAPNPLRYAATGVNAQPLGSGMAQPATGVNASPLGTGRSGFPPPSASSGGGFGAYAGGGSGFLAAQTGPKAGQGQGQSFRSAGSVQYRPSRLR